MNIIKNIWGNDDDKKGARKASAHSKFCGICQEAFARDKDDFRLPHCNECHTSGRVNNPNYWKTAIALQKANTLSPDMAFLASKLNKDSDLFNGGRIQRSEASESLRNVSEIRKAQSAHAASLSEVKDQVMDMLPSVLAELGLKAKIDTELLADMIVPTKIASPIVDPQGGRAAMKSIVMECLAHLNMTRDMQREAAIQPHGKVTLPQDAAILDEGIKRVSNEYGSRTRLISIIAAEQAEQMEHDVANAGAEVDTPATDPAEEMAPGDAAGLETGSPVGEDLNRATAVHIPDEQADAMTGNAVPPIQTQEDPTAGMPMLNEGIGTHSGGENFVPDASDLENMPQEGVRRVEQAASDNYSRKLMYKPVKVEQPKFAEMFTFAGKLSKQLPVQNIRLSNQDRSILSMHQPINHIVAGFTDNSVFDWKYYATDSGYLFVSASDAYHAKSLDHFADFVESDASFARWASLPPDLSEEPTPVPPTVEDNHEVDEMALPEAGVGEADPGFNEAPETHLAPSDDNSIENGGLMNQEDKIFENSGAENNPVVEGDREEQLLDTATEMLPHIEKMFPHETPEAQQDLAIQAALHVLEKLVK